METAQSITENPRTAVVWVILALVIVQVAASLFFAPTAWRFTRTGAMSVIDLGLTTFSTGLLLAGALLLVARSRLSAYVLGTATALALLSLHQWQPLISITCALLALGAFIFSVFYAWSASKVASSGA